MCNDTDSEIINNHFRLSYIANVTCLDNDQRSDQASFKEDFEHQPNLPVQSIVGGEDKTKQAAPEIQQPLLIYVSHCLNQTSRNTLYIPSEKLMDSLPLLLLKF